MSEGLYPGSLFYNAKGSFHLFNTCNTWVARMLETAGVAILPDGIITAGELMTRLRVTVGGSQNAPVSLPDLGEQRHTWR